MNKLDDIKRKVKKTLRYYHKRAIILMYHRVVDIPSSPYHGIVSTEHFEQQMEYIHKSCHVIPLTDLIDAIRNKSLPKKGVVITFDDGYADNYHFAYPILQKYSIPATIFITSNYISSKKEYWWDELERIFLITEQLPENIPVNLLGEEIVFDLSKLSVEQRQIHLRAFHSFLKPLKPINRDLILNALGKFMGLKENGRENYLPMTKDELLQLSGDKLIHIGAHTLTHPMLSALSSEEQQDEIINSKSEIEKIINKPVSTFAYPYGTSADFNSDTVNIIRSQGFTAAVTTIPGIVNHNSNLALLPRIWVGNWDADKFRQNIELHLV